MFWYIVVMFWVAVFNKILQDAKKCLLKFWHRKPTMVVSLEIEKRNSTKCAKKNATYDCWIEQHATYSANHQIKLLEPSLSLLHPFFPQFFNIWGKSSVDNPDKRWRACNRLDLCLFLLVVQSGVFGGRLPFYIQPSITCVLSTQLKMLF